MNMQKLSVVLATAILVGAGIINPAYAGVVKKIYSPYVEAGELEIELQNGIDFDHNQDKDGKIQNKLSVGYGITDRWAAELYGVWEKSGVEGEEAQFTEVSLENRYQLFERGQYPVDVGLYLEIAKSLEHHSPDGIEGKILLEKDFSKIANMANITLEKEVGPYSEKRLEAGFAWSTRYLYNEKFEPGVEWYADFGEVSKTEPYKEQSHQIGPVVYGKLFGHLKYNIGYLFGASKAAPDGEVKSILEYEMRF